MFLIVAHILNYEYGDKFVDLTIKLMENHKEIK